MKNDFCNHYPDIPFYPDERDYTTNAPSYYDDLARKNHLLKILAKKIYDYDKELAKRFEEWDKNLIDFPEDVKILLKKWINDGTLEKIINKEIFSFKLDAIPGFLSIYQMPAPFENAKGNGIDSDSHVFQNAVNYLSARGGGVIFLGKGDFVFTETVYWKSNVSMIGIGNQSKIIMKGELFSAIRNTDGDGQGADGLLAESFLENIRFENFEIDGSNLTHKLQNADGKGIFILYMRKAVFKNLYIHHTIGTGLGCDFLDKSVITQCVVENCGRNWSSGGVGQSGIGVGTNSNPEESLLIEGNVCRNNGNYGIFVETQDNPTQEGTIRSEGARIIGNYCYQNRIGIGNKGSGGTILSNNQVYKNKIGIHLTEGSKDDLISGNRIEKNTDQGIYISSDYKGDLSIINNKIYENRKGIEVLSDQQPNERLDHLMIQGNIIKHNDFAGFQNNKKIINFIFSQNQIIGNGKKMIEGYKQGILFSNDIEFLSLQNNLFYADGFQNIAIEIANGKKIKNGTISENNLSDYSVENGFAYQSSQIEKTRIENNGNTIERQSGTNQMSIGFNYVFVEFPKPFDRPPTIIQVFPQPTSENIFWVSDVTRYGFSIRTNTKNDEIISWNALR